jgi:quercetin dioxygenase-like cupin family protein
MSEVRIVAATELVASVPTPGMERREAVADSARILAVRTEPGLISGWHHHADYTTYGYIIAGRLRLESGPAGEAVVEGVPGDFFIVPPRTVHRESNPSDEEQVIVGFRLGEGETVVNVAGPDA